jgi:hypothetical protein
VAIAHVLLSLICEQDQGDHRAARSANLPPRLHLRQHERARAPGARHRTATVEVGIAVDLTRMRAGLYLEFRVTRLV